MDIFIEQLVKKQKTAKTTLYKFCIVFILFLLIMLCFVLAVLVHTYFFMIAFFVLIIGIYGCWFFISNLNVEFEYSVTNNNLAIDKVLAKRKRKKVISIEIKSIEEMCQIKQKEIKGKADKILFAGETESGAKEYQILVHTEKYGRTLIVFSPDERTINAMKTYLKNSVRVSL
ncbi:hypothetical protein AGMMS50284_5420 [Clostridia bacterium]|nr:hypothetical protein AGMMS50284_5420 [Clostridia bacterium]